MSIASAQFGPCARARCRTGLAFEKLEGRFLLSGTGNLVFDDEFNQAVGTQPNAAAWEPYLANDPNNQNVTYTNSTSTLSIVADPAATDDRAAAITLIPEGGGKYNSAEISTQIDPVGDSLEYGEVSARIKLPSATNAAGVWPAFWMLGNNLNTPEQPNNTTQWPEAGEIDIVENKGSTPGQAQGSLHAGSVSGNPDYGPTGYYNLPSGQVFSSAYHIFSISWTPTSISFSVDGNVYETQNISPSGVPSDDVGRFQHPFFIILNISEGGLFAGTNNSVTTPTTMYVDYVRVSGYQLASSPYTLPASPSLTDADIGSPGLGGSSNFDGVAWIESGSGSDIFGTSDQFNFASQAVTGDVTIIAQVDTITNTADFAKAGIMIRDGTAANASYAFTFVNPNDGVSGEGANFEYRNGAGTSSQSDNSTSGITAPEWLKLVRAGNTFTAYYSSDGSTWVQNGTPQTIVMGSTVNVGLAVSANTNSALNTATFLHASVLPDAFADADIGSPNVPGSAAYNASTGIWTVAGGGADIFGSADQFNLASQTLTGDGSIVAEVTSIANTNAWAKAGVMLRNDTTSGSAYVTVDETDGNGITFQWRSVAGGNVVSADTVTVAGLSAPYWVELTRSGNVFSAFYSANGTNWTQIGSSQTISMNGSVLAGLAVTSHDNFTLNQATFKNVAVNANFADQTGSILNVSFDTNADPIALGTSGASMAVTENGNTLHFSGITAVNVNFVSGASDVLNINSGISAPISFTGEGTSDSVNINSGAATFAAGASGLGIQSMSLGTISIGGGALLVLASADTTADRMWLTVNTLSIQGAMDVGNNEITVNYGTSQDPISAIQSLLASGYNGGAWNGAGIFSSTVAAENASQSALVYGIGYADGADGITAVSAGQIEIMPTLTGDTNLQDSVLFGDFQVLAQYLGQSGSWDQGNFTYASTIGFGDYQLLAQNFGQSVSLNGSSGGAAGIAPAAGKVAANSSLSAGDAESIQPIGGDVTDSLLVGSAIIAGDAPLFSDLPLI